MNNFDAYENEVYENATPLNVTISKRLSMIFKLIIVTVKISISLVIELSENFVRLLTGLGKKNIENQLAVVTGGANGLGRELACKLAGKKCNVAIADINIIEAMKTADFIEKTYKVKTKAFKIDVSKFDEVQKLKTDIEDSLGHVDILVNNAGIVPIISLREGSPQDIKKIIDVNLTSHFWTTRTFLDGMIERKRGHIIGICSVSGKISFPCATAYSATKHGITGFMNALYDELCAFDHEEYVKLTTVFPYFINTRKELGNILDETDEIIQRLTPEYVANEVINALLMEKCEIHLPYGIQLLSCINFLPRKTLKLFKTKSFSSEKFFKIVKNQRNMI